MWGRQKSAKRLKTARIDTLIGRGVEVRGDVVFTAGLHVDGVIKGSVYCREGSTAFLTLSETGIIEGEVRVPNAVLNGRVVGDVITTEHVELKSKAEVTGDLCYVLLEMAVGAEVNGSLIHADEEEGAASQLVKVD